MTSQSQLAKLATGSIARQDAPLTVGQLEQSLLRRFPRDDAEPWDRTGLLVGDPAQTVGAVAVALDATSQAIDQAVALGADVLLTHHPAFLDPPEVVSPSRAIASAPGVNVFKAVRGGVALMNFHTALDVSPEALRMLPEMLGLEFQGVLVPAGDDPRKGYGQLCAPRPDEAPLPLSHLAARCTSVFGRAPRVWGDFHDRLGSIVIANGSAGNVVDACLKRGVECLVCGEVRYHVALDASQAGLCIVELGHDASELHLAALLARAAVEAGVAPDAVTVLDQSSNWRIPDSTRI